MKKVFISIIVLTMQIVHSQATDNKLPKRDTQKNDLSINIHPFAIIDGININYDRVFNKDISVGASIFIAYKNQNTIDNTNIQFLTSADFAIISNIKYYVAKKFARNFYLQGLAIVSTGRSDDFNDINFREVNFTDVALGFGIGDKRILKNGIFIDFGLAIAANLLSDKSPQLMVHPNLSFGYRF